MNEQRVKASFSIDRAAETHYRNVCGLPQTALLSTKPQTATTVGYTNVQLLDTPTYNCWIHPHTVV